MSKQRDLHNEAIDHLNAVKAIVDQLKNLGPCPMDLDNALLNIRERAVALADRARPPRGWAER